LDSKTRQNVITSLLKTRKIKPPENNWLLFAAMIEAFFITINEPFEMARIDYAINSTSYGIKATVCMAMAQNSLGLLQQLCNPFLTCTIS